MGNNFFLTGDLHVGKTTLIDRIIDSLDYCCNISGFRTSRYYEGGKLAGFYIQDVNKEHEAPKDNFIGRCINEDHWVSIPATFDGHGVKLLTDCVNAQPDLIVMDELGFFENNAALFQNKVLEILDSDMPVLGVLKRKDTPFLNNIRSRDDVSIFTVSQDNRDRMFPIVLERIRKVLCLNEETKKPGIDVQSYEKTAREVFAPVYPVIAKQIKQRTGITSGLCVDIGAGTGHLGIEIAKITDLSVCLMDNSKGMLTVAEQNIANSGLDSRVKTMLGDVHNIPADDSSIDLIVSRGSLYFWQDKKRAFKEIYRVLSPGGAAYVGGGFGTVELKRKIDTEMQKRDNRWRKNMAKKIKNTNLDYNDLMKAIDISDFRVIKNSANMWILIRKRAEQSAAALCRNV
jgi:nucleoside-triphosphatase THEP1/ubiquinone/menaquinone biosynthesis C-methylase UbiE